MSDEEREERKIRRRKVYLKHREKELAYSREYAKNNADKSMARNLAYQRRKREDPIKYLKMKYEREGLDYEIDEHALEIVEHMAKAPNSSLVDIGNKPTDPDILEKVRLDYLSGLSIPKIITKYSSSNQVINHIIEPLGVGVGAKGEREENKIKESS